MTRVLLVTGSRSLADNRDAERWARALIAEALAGTYVAQMGDAREGIDKWAREEAIVLGVTVRCYVTRGANAGYVVLYKNGRVEVLHRWTKAVPPTDAATHAEWAAWLKLRNREMVEESVFLGEHVGLPVEGLALLDGRKPAKPAPGEKRPTRGTEHTVGLARKAGLSVREERWAL